MSSEMTSHIYEKLSFVKCSNAPRHPKGNGNFSKNSTWTTVHSYGKKIHFKTCLTICRYVRWIIDINKIECVCLLENIDKYFLKFVVGKFPLYDKVSLYKRKVIFIFTKIKCFVHQKHWQENEKASCTLREHVLNIFISKMTWFQNT